MKSIFAIDNKLFTFLSRIVDLVLLNISFLITCIPIVTIGASITALYSVTLKMAKNEESYIIKSYFKNFKANFKEATLIWIIMVLGALLLLLDMRILRGSSNNLFKVLLGVLCIVQLIWLIMITFVFPIVAQFQSSLIGNIKNALFIPLSRIFYSLLVMICTYLPLIAILYIKHLFIYGCYFFVMGGLAGVALLNSYLLHRIFSPYIGDLGE